MPLLAGVGCGVLSAWGIGGGTLLLLVMTLAFGVDQAAAQGINLLYFLPTAAIGLIWHRQNGLLDKAVLRRKDARELYLRPSREARQGANNGGSGK